jgi:hypothetical protein
MARIRTCSSLRGKGGVRSFAALIAVGAVFVRLASDERESVNPAYVRESLCPTGEFEQMFEWHV